MKFMFCLLFFLSSAWALGRTEVKTGGGGDSGFGGSSGDTINVGDAIKCKKFESTPFVIQERDKRCRIDEYGQRECKKITVETYRRLDKKNCLPIPPTLPGICGKRIQPCIMDSNGNVVSCPDSNAPTIDSSFGGVSEPSSITSPAIPSGSTK